MIELFEAIQTHYKGQAIAERASLYAYHADEGAVLPWLTWMLVNSNPDDTFSDSLDDTLIQFSIWSEQKSPLEATELRDLLTAAMDEATLNVRGGTTIRCKRETERLVEEPGYGFAYHIDYRISIQ